MAVQVRTTPLTCGCQASVTRAIRMVGPRRDNVSSIKPALYDRAKTGLAGSGIVAPGIALSANAHPDFAFFFFVHEDPVGDFYRRAPATPADIIKQGRTHCHAGRIRGGKSARRGGLGGRVSGTHGASLAPGVCPFLHSPIRAGLFLDSSQGLLEHPAGCVYRR